MSSKVRSIKRAQEARKESQSISVSLSDLISSQGAFRMLLAQPLQAKYAFQLGKIAKAATVELQQFDQTRLAMCEKYSDKDADGKPKMVPEGEGEKFDIPEEKMADFNKELEELKAVEVSLPYERLKIDHLQGINIPAGHLMALEWLLAD